MRKRAQESLPKRLGASLDAGHPVGYRNCGRRRGLPAISSLGGWRMGCGSPFDPLPEHIRGHADADAERAAYFLWLHGKSLAAG